MATRNINRSTGILLVVNFTALTRVAERGRSRFDVSESPVTAALIVAFILVYVTTRLDFDHRIFEKFAKVDDRVRAGEVWRLFTASFLHACLTHIGFNAMALGSIGPTIERLYGKLRYLATFLVGGAIGMGASVVLVPQPSVGASAGLFALLGLLLAFAVRSRSRLAPEARRSVVIQVVVIVGLNIVLGLLAGYIDTAAHVGGLVGGLLLGFVLRPVGNRGAQPSQALVATPVATVPPANVSRAVPERSRRRAKRRYLGWAGQRWRTVAVFVGTAPLPLFWFGPSARLLSWLGPLGFLLWPMLALAVGWAIFATARCPRCRAWVFWLVDFKSALQAEACPACDYPDGGGKRKNIAPGGPKFSRVLGR